MPTNTKDAVKAEPVADPADAGLLDNVQSTDVPKDDAPKDDAPAAEARQTPEGLDVLNDDDSEPAVVYVSPSDGERYRVAVSAYVRAGL